MEDAWQTTEAPRRRRSPLGPIVLAAASVVLAGCVLAALHLLRRGTSTPALIPHATTIPVEDREAPTALKRAAAAIHFEAIRVPGTGTIENDPAAAERPARNPDLLQEGAPAPPFVLETATGHKVSLAGLRGKVVLVEFFATWCPHCQAEAPHLARMARTLSASRFAFLGINADSEDRPSVFAFHRYFGLPFPALLDPGGVPGSFHRSGSPGRISQTYRVKAFPTFYVLDSKGRITWRTDGEQPDALLLAQLRTAGDH